MRTLEEEKHRLLRRHRFQMTAVNWFEPFWAKTAAYLDQRAKKFLKEEKFKKYISIREQDILLG